MSITRSTETFHLHRGPSQYLKEVGHFNSCAECSVVGTSVLEWSRMKTSQGVKYVEKINSKMNTFTLYSSLDH